MNKTPFIQLVKCDQTKELLKDHNAFMLLTQIAYRAKRTDKFSIHNLEIGQALIGDYKSIGLTEQKYRLAKKRLEKYSLATFKGTNKGTVATLLNTNVYNINVEEKNEQENSTRTNKERTGNEQGTTNKNVNKDKKEKNIIPVEIVDNFKEYKAMRAGNKKVMTLKAEKMALNKLNELAPKDYSKQNLILEQSIFNSWQGLFSIKQNFNDNNNKYNNPEDRY